jgi:tetratricopeptide (TPR) repeat protein/ADP-heptose:LPS heptosyltransferase
MKQAPRYSQPLWVGQESLSGKTILVHSEQGLGDTIQFCRYVKLVAALGAKVILAVPRPLLRLLACQAGASQVIAQDGVLPDFDYQCPLMSLPLAFKTRLEGIPQPTRYLSGAGDAVEQWRLKLGEKSGLRVGLVWSGNRAHKNDHRRSIPLPEMIAALPLQCQYISLQKDLSERDLRTLESNPQILNFAQELTDFSDTAALCECMDVVISVDTSVAHLSAALGKNTWILLPRNCDWRWLTNRSDSPWYSTATLYRQASADDWSEVFQHVHADLVRTAESLAQTSPANRSAKGGAGSASGRRRSKTPHRPGAKTAVNPGETPVPSTLRLALALHQRGQLAQAQTKYQEILELQPEHFDALNMLGVIALQTGKHDKALQLLGRAIELDPGNAAVHFNRGAVLQALNKPDEALTSYDRAVAIKPDYAEGHCNRGLALAELKRWDDALVSCDRALAIHAEFAQAHYNRGVVLKELGRWDEALTSYERAIALEPGFAEGYCNRGLVLAQLDRWEAALASYDQAIAIKPQFADAHFNRGLVLSKLERADAALASFDRAIALQPEFAEAWYNRGLVLAHVKQVNAALASYDRAIAIMPGYVEAHQNRSWMQLLSGDLARGWIGYEWRWKEANGADIKHKRTFRRPLWLGDGAIVGKTVLLHAEQGLGDTIQFCRYAKCVAELGASVILEVPSPLAPLLEHLEGVSTLIRQGNALPDFDVQCPLLSLPLALETTLDSIPSPQGYLSAAPAKVAQWRGMLGEQRAPRVGLAWSGSAVHKNDHNRSISFLEMVRHLPAEFEYVSLQKDLRETDRQALAANPNVVNFSDALSDFSDTAALCACMDVVVSVDSSVAHLSGALGKSAWILLPHHPDWRWLMEREDSPWYASVRLYRQTGIGDWDGVLRRVRADLIAWRKPREGGKN